MVLSGQQLVSPLLAGRVGEGSGPQSGVESDLMW